MKEGCNTLACDSNGIDITFKSELFGLEDNEEGINWEVGENNKKTPSWASTHWSLSCAFGDCEMTKKVENEK